MLLKAETFYTIPGYYTLLYSDIPDSAAVQAVAHEATTGDGAVATHLARSATTSLRRSKAWRARPTQAATWPVSSVSDQIEVGSLPQQITVDWFPADQPFLVVEGGDTNHWVKVVVGEKIGYIVNREWLPYMVWKPE